MLLVLAGQTGAFLDAVRLPTRSFTDASRVVLADTRILLLARWVPLPQGIEDRCSAAS